MIKSACCFLFLVSATILCQGQVNQVIPIQFHQFYKTYFLANPAAAGLVAPLEFNLGENSMTGSFKGIRTIYANLNLCIRDTSGRNGQRQFIGGTFINDREGSYIKRNRVHLLYCIQIPVSNQWMLQAGLNAGFVNFAYEGTNISAGGSDFAPSVDAGLWMHHPRMNIGVAIDQINQGKLTPLDQNLVLRRYYTISGDYSLFIASNVTAQLAANYRYTGINTSTLDAALLVYIQQSLVVGSSVRYTKGFTVFGGINKIALGNGALQFLISYFSPFSRAQGFNAQTLELSVNYFPGKK